MKRLLLAMLLMTGVAYAQYVPVYHANRSSDQLYIADSTTWTSTGWVVTMNSSIGAIDGLTGMATQPCSGQIYVSFILSSSGERYLGTLDTTSGFITSIGAFGDNVASITFESYDVLYAVTGDGAATSETLYEVDITTGAMTFKTTLGLGSDGEGISFNYDDGLIYHWSGFGPEIMETIDPVTNATAPIAMSGYSTGGEIMGAHYMGGGDFIITHDDEFVHIDATGFSSGSAGFGADDIKALTMPIRYAYFTTNDSICPGDTAMITSLNGDAYEWFLDGVTTGVTTQTIDATDEGDYYCMVTLDTCVYATNTVSLVVLNAPNVNLNPSPTAYLCAPGDSVLIHGPMGGSAQWYMNGSMLAGETNDSIWVFSTGGIYNMTKTNMNGCTDSAAVGTTVLAPPALMLNAPDGDTVCTGDNLLLVASSGGSYTWYMDGTAIAGETNDSIYVTAGGTYSVAAMFGDCSDSTATGITVVEEDCDAGIATSIVEIKMFPNPTSGLVNISLDAISGDKITIRITGMDGRIHQSISEALNKSNYEIDLSSLEAGNYIVHVSIDGTDYIQQIAKK